MATAFGDERARRYWQAQQAHPAARTAELLGLLPACLPADDSRSSVAVDLGAGTGYLSVLLDQIYDDVIRIDISPAMLQAPGDVEDDEVVADIGLAVDQVSETRLIDLVASLAVLHHICIAVDGVVDITRTEARQSEVIARWSNRLRTGGRMVIADVGARISSNANYLPALASAFSGTWAREFTRSWLDDLDRKLPGYGLSDALQIFAPTDRNDAVNLPILLRSYDEQGLEVDRWGPIPFFDEIVATRSIDGHEAFFHDEETLRTLLVGAGLTDVVVGVIPTPWLFNSEADAFHFAREIFGLTETADNTLLARYLQPRRHGQMVVVPWQLLYGMGVKG